MPDLSFITGITTKYHMGRSQLLLLILSVIMLGNLFYVSDVNILESKSYASIFSIIMIVIGISIYKIITDKDQSILLSGGIVAIFAIFIIGGILVEFYQKYMKDTAIFDSISNDPNTRILINIVQISLVISIVIVGISTLNNFIGRYLNNSTTWNGFILNLIVYVPCLFEDLVKYFKQEYGLTSSVTFILLTIEMLLIAAYVLIPKLLSSAIKTDAIPVTSDPLFLDISTTKTFDKQDDGIYKNKRTNYAFSMWLYLNQQTSSTQNANIFTYGELYPKIEYVKCANDTGKDKYRFTVGEQSYDISIQGQKWNNIVVNFNENDTADIFVNGNLERTFKTSKRQTMENSLPNTINIGSNNGLYGAICNINYHKTPLTPTQIAQTYNLLYNKNPPVNNIL
jgi:hypothetical protein